MDSTARTSGDVTTAITVMAHPRRRTQALRIAASLTPVGGAAPGEHAEVVLDPMPDGPPSALRTAARAWARCEGPGTTHHVVVQDDVVPVEGFADRVRTAIGTAPDDALALYANSTSWNGAAARAAAFTGHRSVAPVPGEYLPTLATVLPCPVAHAFAEAATQKCAAGESDDDEALVGFLAARGVRARLWVPNLVDHSDGPSLSGWGFQGIRRSVCFTGVPDVEPGPGADPGAGLGVGDAASGHLDTLAAWPRFAHRRAMLRMPSRLGRERWQTRTRASQLAALGISWEQVVDAGERALTALGPSPLPERRAKVRRLTREVWLAGYGLGHVVAATGTPPERALRRTPAARAAVRSLVESGLGRHEVLGRWRSLLGRLDETVWDGVTAAVGAPPVPGSGRVPGGSRTNPPDRPAPSEVSA